MPSASTRELLGQINAFAQKNAPETLFWEGDRSLLGTEVKVSVVGTRNLTEEGRNRAARLTRELVDKGAVVVSGLAEGVDTVAHKTAIQQDGKTIAVLGHGLDKVFPPSNRALLDEIFKNHLAISQFAPGVPPTRGNFPQRNRTMALISDATVIVEAGESSGTKHQGWEALRLGRPLFLLNSLAESGFAWVDEMLEYGARPLTDTAQIFEIMPAMLGVPTVAEAF